MADDKKSFWTTVPGVISGVAAIVTGLGVLIPIMLGVGGKHTNTSKNTASQNNAANPPSSTVTSTGSGSTDTSSPPAADSSSGTTGSASPDTGSSPGAPLALTASPPTVSFGSVRAGLSSSDSAITITNPGGAAVTIEHVSITGSNGNLFSISSSTCGEGTAVPPKGSCRVSVKFSPTSAFASATGQLRVDYHPPQSSFLTVELSGTATLL